MASSAILAIRIIGDATSAVTALDKVDGSARSMEATMGQASLGAGLALGAITAAATAAGGAASELQQATGAVDAAFGSYSDSVHKAAETAAEDVGLSKKQYSEMAAVLGSQLKNMGVDMDKVGGKSADLIAVGADLAATFGGTTADAVGAVSSLLRGERDPIERYGVSLKQVDIDAKLAAMGLDGLTGEAEKAATTQATLALLTEQTASATGRFADEADTAAGRQQTATAAWDDAQAMLGEQLLPYMVDAATALADIATWAGENTETVTILIGVIAGLAMGILAMNGALQAYQAVQALATLATWASNAAWLASPITWIVLAIILALALVVGAVLLVIKYWDELRFAGEYAFAVIVAGIERVLNWLSRMADAAVPEWLQALLGLDLGGQINLSGTSVTMPSATEAPALSRMAAPTLAPDLGGLGASAGGGGVTNNYNTTVNGALDPNAVARQIDTLMTSNRRSSGSLAAAGATW